MLIYIASPYTLGDTALNVRAQIEAAEEIINLGHVPYVPLLTHFWHMISPHDHHYWMNLDRPWLLQCDAVLRLPGESKGAEEEVRVAQIHKMMVFYSLQEIEDFT